MPQTDENPAKLPSTKEEIIDRSIIIFPRCENSYPNNCQEITDFLRSF